MKVVFYSPGKDAQPWLDDIAAQLPDAEVWGWSPQAADRQADYAIVWAPPAELFARQHQLKAIFNIGAGVDRVLQVPNLRERLNGAIIVRLNDAGMAVQMAEYVCHALIRYARQFAAYAALQQQREWRQLAAIDRAAWPVGIMGLGIIGARVARAVAAFDYPTFGWSRTSYSLDGIRVFTGAAGLDDFLHEVRVLVCVLPLTDETEGLLNRHTFAQLKPEACLINVARGRHLVEADLIAALDSGAMSGATLDVFHDEPLPAHHPFWRHRKITLTPHISAITLRDDSVRQIAEKIRALERGLPVEGVVQWERGY